MGQLTVTVPPTVNRIIGFGSGINTYNGGGITFKVAGNSSHPLIVEQFGYGVTVEHDSPRTVAVKHGDIGYRDSPAAGPAFLEDISTAPLTISAPHAVWARQLNAEGRFTKVTNTGGTLWVLGLKTEGKGTVCATTKGGKTEILGTLIYPVDEFSTTDQQQPAFSSVDASQSLIYALSVYGANRNYAIQVQETRHGVTRRLPSSAVAGRMPLFVGYLIPTLATPVPTKTGSSPAALTPTPNAAVTSTSATPQTGNAGKMLPVLFFTGTTLAAGGGVAFWLVRRQRKKEMVYED